SSSPTLYRLSLHDALPILNLLGDTFQTLDLPLFLTSVIIPSVAMIGLPIVMLFLLRRRYAGQFDRRDAMIALFTGFMVVWLETRSEEHTSELQSRGHVVCR